MLCPFARSQPLHFSVHRLRLLDIAQVILERDPLAEGICLTLRGLRATGPAHPRLFGQERADE